MNRFSRVCLPQRTCFDNRMLYSMLVAFCVMQKLSPFAQAVNVDAEFEGVFTTQLFHRLDLSTANDGDFVLSNDTEILPLPQPVVEFQSLNSSIAGTFSYDTELIPDPPSSSTPFYFPTTTLTCSFVLPSGPTFLQDSFPTMQLGNVDDEDFGPSDFFRIDSFDNDEINLANPTPQTIVIDLTQDSTFSFQMDGVANFDYLPVRFTEPVEISAEAFEVLLADHTGTAFSSIYLPTTMDLSEFSDASFYLEYSYEMQISVDPADYPTMAAYQIAADYVTSNLLSVKLYNTLRGSVTHFTASASPGSTEDQPLLPENSEPPFEFDVEVDGPESTIWYDPPLAVGYEYEVLQGPNFYSVQLPSLATIPQTGLYELEVFNGSEYLLAALLAPGESYIFAGDNGVSQFRIMGIDASLALDPNDQMAFPTGLSFVSSGQVQFSMTPILAVPEPNALTLSLIGAGILACRHRRRQLPHPRGFAPPARR